MSYKLPVTSYKLQITSYKLHARCDAWCHIECACAKTGLGPDAVASLSYFCCGACTGKAETRAAAAFLIDDPRTGDH